MHTRAHEQHNNSNNNNSKFYSIVYIVIDIVVVKMSEDIAISFAGHIAQPDL